MLFLEQVSDLSLYKSRRISGYIHMYIATKYTV